MSRTLVSLGGVVPTNIVHYQALVAKLQDQAAARLREACDNLDSLREAITFYLGEGTRLGLSPSELTDLFCVSTPNIIEMAGYADAAGDPIVSLFDEVHNQLRRKA